MTSVGLLMKSGELAASSSIRASITSAGHEPRRLSSWKRTVDSRSTTFAQKWTATSLGLAKHLGYKIGELKIRELRARAEKELADRFDIREFHDVVLRQGAVPMDILEQNVMQYIEETGRNAGN